MAQNGGRSYSSRRFTAASPAAVALPSVAAATASSNPATTMGALPPALLPSSVGLRAGGTSPDSPSPQRPARDRITLAQPRPDGLRLPNYYTETPFRPPKPSRKSGKDDNNDDDAAAAAGDRDDSHAIVHRVDLGGGLAGLYGGPRRTLDGGGGGVGTALPDRRRRCPPPASSAPRLPLPSSTAVSAPLAITSQPCVAFSKGGGGGGKETDDTGRDAADDAQHRASIICGECGRCTCDACRSPRSLPSKWVCNNNYECSAEAIVDTCSCMCCVKGLFYHSTKDYDMDDDVSCADKPCSCNAHRRCLRWSCMGLIALVLPCLLCYWPMKGCLKVCEMCYARYHSRGCQCTQRRKESGESPPNSNKRLLDPGCD